MMKDYDRTTSSLRPRSRAEIGAFFGDDWDIIEPGVVWISDWYVDGAPAASVAGGFDSSRSQGYGAVGRKR